MKAAAFFAMTYLSVNQFETRHRMVEAERELNHARAASRQVVEHPRRRRSPRRWFRALRGATA